MGPGQKDSQGPDSVLSYVSDYLLGIPLDGCLPVRRMRRLTLFELHNL